MIEIPIIGHRFCIVLSAQETGGESLRLEYSCRKRSWRR